MEERLSALGNCVVTNDHVALVHTDLDRVGPLVNQIRCSSVFERDYRS